MLNPTRGLNWVGRALVLGLSCVAVTAVGHAAAGGRLPLVGMLLVTALMFVGAIFATSRELSWQVLLAFLLGSQVVSHLLLNGFGHAHSAAPLSAGSTDRASHIGTHMVGSPTQTLDAARPVEGAQGSALSMVLAHLVVCAVVAIVLREGERVMFTLHRILPNVLRVLFGLIVGRRPASLPVTRTPAPLRTLLIPHPRRIVVCTSVARRGPPALAVS